MGVLQRKDIRITSIIHIGKESNNLIESEIMGLDDSNYEIYRDEYEIDKKIKEIAPKILELKPKDVKEYGISKQTLWNMKKKIVKSQFERISGKVKIVCIFVLINE